MNDIPSNVCTYLILNKDKFFILQSNYCCTVKESINHFDLTSQELMHNLVKDFWEKLPHLFPATVQGLVQLNNSFKFYIINLINTGYLRC